MTERIIEIAEAGARLRIETGLLRIADPEGVERERVVLADLACLVLGHPQISVTHAALSQICLAGGAVVLTDEKRQPVAWLLPLGRHSTQNERFRAQAEAGKPLQKRLWQRLVQAKIAGQAATLALLHGDDAGLGALAAEVRSGDPDNLEARAAQRYWPLVFADPEFRRRREAEDQNRLLNYGYTVLRAAVARAICGSGLHPGLGVHHHNRYDGMPLADDLMEPFRPVVDRVVAKIVAERGAAVPMDQETRRQILGELLGRYEVEGENRTLFDLLARSAASLARSFTSDSVRLDLPAL